MFVRVLLVLSLAVAMLASRGPAELTDDGEVAAAVLDVDRVVVTTVEPAATWVAREVMKAHRASEVAPASPELGRVFRPPERIVLASR